MDGGGIVFGVEEILVVREAIEAAAVIDTVFGEIGCVIQNFGPLVVVPIEQIAVTHIVAVALGFAPGEIEADVLRTGCSHVAGGPQGAARQAQIDRFGTFAVKGDNVVFGIARLAFHRPALAFSNGNLFVCDLVLLGGSVPQVEHDAIAVAFGQ